VDPSKLPGKEKWLNLLADEQRQPLQNKKFYYVIWLLNNTPVGHSNINKIIFGEEAYMHLHIWNSDKRQKGIGLEFIKMSLPYYFDKLKLKRLYCEPSALNPAPNKILQKIGFDFEKKYEIIPGWINFYQTVNRCV
jgi:ribosomal-protein-alanine N-acetyltransferase